MLELIAAYGHLGAFLVSLLVNLIPFASPSNAVLAGAFAALLPNHPKWSMGLGVALGATLAKAAHFYLSGLGGALLESKGLGKRMGRELNKWGALLAFLVAATPIPDDPIVIPLGAAGYSAWRFLMSYFLGKALICIAGAYVGGYAILGISDLLGDARLAIASLMASLLILSAILKLDISKLLSRALESRGEDGSEGRS
ncbi:MAG: VTT domain-containing protein [Candidatus Bathyarchaeia archaeon]